MDYIGYKCPVCDKYFHVGDDVVVCPECGTPHHRECYKNLGHCVNEDKHSQGFDYIMPILDACKEAINSDGKASTLKDLAREATMEVRMRMSE